MRVSNGRSSRPEMSNHFSMMTERHRHRPHRKMGRPIRCIFQLQGISRTGGTISEGQYGCKKIDLEQHPSTSLPMWIGYCHPS
jgi:hypothetical protein